MKMKSCFFILSVSFLNTSIIKSKTKLIKPVINMKKIFLLINLLASMVGFSQLNNAGDGYKVDYLDANSNCLVNFGFPNQGGIQSMGNTFLEDSLDSGTPNGLELRTVPNLTSDFQRAVSYYSLPFLDGFNCSTLALSEVNIDLSEEGTGILEIEVSSNMYNSELEICLAGPGKWFPESSTLNIGDNQGMKASIRTGAANEKRTYYINY